MGLEFFFFCFVLFLEDLKKRVTLFSQACIQVLFKTIFTVPTPLQVYLQRFITLIGAYYLRVIKDFSFRPLPYHFHLHFLVLYSFSLLLLSLLFYYHYPVVSFFWNSFDNKISTRSLF